MSGVLVVSCARVATATNVYDTDLDAGTDLQRNQLMWLQKLKPEKPLLSPVVSGGKKNLVFEKSSDPVFLVRSRWFNVILTPEDRELPPYQVTPPPAREGERKGER